MLGAERTPVSPDEPCYEDGLLLEDAEPFEALMARCADIAARVNRGAK